MYFLVLLRDAAPEPPEVDHEPFIDWLDERNLVLLGGPFEPEPSPGISAAYVLRCASREEAEGIVALDPLVSSGACKPTVVEWQLVGINRAAIDPPA
jgi:uncharacterized protein YciI